MRKLFAITLLVGLATFLTASLAGAPDKTTGLKKGDQDWNRATQAKNLDQFMSFLADDVSMCDLSGKWTQGKDAIKADWTQAFADPTFRLTWSVESAEVSKSGDLGYTRGSFSGSQGNQPFSGSYATVWKRDKAGKWKVAVDIGSAVPQK